MSFIHKLFFGFDSTLAIGKPKGERGTDIGKAELLIDLVVPPPFPPTNIEEVAVVGTDRASEAEIEADKAELDGFDSIFFKRILRASFRSELVVIPECKKSEKKS